MLQISRKLFALPFNQVYFQELKRESIRYEPKVICYTHVLKPSRKLQGQQALHIDLKKGEQFYGVSDTLLTLLMNEQTEKWTISRFHHPTDQQIEDFQQFYNLYAKQKDSGKLNKFDAQTLKLLRDQGGLLMTKVESEQQEAIGYRVYVVGEEMVMALYSAERALPNESIKLSPNYFLCWENMKYFSKQSYQLYDFGDIKDSTVLQELKENFGGKLVTVFSGYISNSLVSQMLLQFNLKGLKKKLSYSQS